MIENNTKPLVYVVDDDSYVRSTIEMMVITIGYQCRTFSDGIAFFRHFDTETTGCLVLDVKLPTISGMEVQRRLEKANFLHPIIMVSGVQDVALAVEAMRCGAHDFITKPLGLHRLRESIDSAIQLTVTRRQQRESQKSLQERIGRLTAKEYRVMELILHGMINKQIAAKLQVSLRTVEKRRASILKKMELDSMYQLLPLFLEHFHRIEGVANANASPHFPLSAQNELN